MPSIAFAAMPTSDAEVLWGGGADAYGHQPETMVSDGPGHPCRHCLRNIDAGEELFVFAYRPFPELQPYAETGPIFLHKTPCKRYEAKEVLPPDDLLQRLKEGKVYMAQQAERAVQIMSLFQ